MYKYLLSAGVLLVIALSYRVFRQFITPDVNAKDPYAYEIAAACLGTALTATLTWFLLKHQSHSEVSRERNVKVYETKLAIYQSLLKRIEDILQDEQLTTKEFFQLQLAFQEVVFIAGARVLNELPGFARVLASVDQDTVLHDQSKKRILHAFGRLAAEVRADLHDPQPHGEDLQFDVEDVLAKIEANFPSHRRPSECRKEEATRWEEQQRRESRCRETARRKRREQAEAKEAAFLQEHAPTNRSVQQLFLERCNVEDRQVYRELFQKFQLCHTSELRWWKWQKSLKPDFDAIGLIFRSRRGRIVLYIHPDSAVPNKIFSDNLTNWQRRAVRDILDKDWSGKDNKDNKDNIVSRWSFTTENVTTEELIKLIDALTGRPASFNNG